MRERIGLLVVLLLLSYVELFAQSNDILVAPQNNLVIEIGEIYFTWNFGNPVEDSFDVQVSSDTDFSSLIVVSSGVESNSISFSDIPVGRFFWRVRGFSSEGFSEWSSHRAFEVVNLYDNPNTLLWLKGSDSVVLDEGHVIEWGDLSEFQNNPTAVSPNSPILIESVTELNNHSVIRFDGIDDYMEFSELHQIRSIAMLMSHRTGTQAGAPILGHEERFDFHGGIGPTEDKVFRNVSAAPSLIGGAGYVNGIEVEVEEIEKSTNYSLLTLVSLDTLVASRLTRDRGISSRVWDGDYCEIILSSSQWTEEERKSIEGYMMDKYAPPVNLGTNLNLQSFCESRLGVQGEYFSEVQWSNSLQTDSIDVQVSGDYSVVAIDIFGRVSKDTISVSYPGHFINPFPLCQSTDSLWDIGLSEADGFSFAWDTPTPNTGPSVVIDEPGMYNVVITDSEGCTREASVEVVQDDYPVSATLGEMTDLCSGNSLSLQSGAESTVEYLWNDQPGTAEFPITDSGTYWLEATNENGCIAQDTIEVNIIGEAPQAAFGYTNLCFGEQVQFVNNASAPAGESIVSQTWSFGDEMTSVDLSPLHSYAAVDTFIVSLQVETAVGCEDSFVDTLIIRPLPEVGLESINLCHDQLAFFSDTSTLSSGVVTSSSWLFEGAVSAEGSDVTHTFAAPGSYPVLLTAQSDFGCEATLDATVEVLGSPIGSFAVDAVCLSEPTIFNAQVDETFSGPANQYFWDFGLLTSIFESTTHTFLSPGQHDVSLTVTAQNGCSDNYIGQAVVGEDPIAGFEIGVACAGQPVQFTDTSIVSAGDQVQSWNWFFSASEESLAQSPTHTFDLPGTYPVSLNVESEVGCSDQVLQEIEVSLVPTADFDFSPILGAPPFAPVFENFSEGATDFLWTFDFEATSTDAIPTHTFTDSGQVQIDLQVWNEAGCTATSSELIFLTEPLVDLVLIDATYELQGDFIYPTLTVTSLGNFDMESFIIDLEVAEGVHLQEVYQGGLERNQVLTYPMNTAVVFDSETDLPFFCIRLIPSDERNDIDDSNNSSCLEIGTGNETYFFRPRPNPLQDELTFTGIKVPEGEFQVECYDMLGRPVLAERLVSMGSLVQDFSLDFSSIPDGRYVLRILQGTEDRVYRIQVLRD